MSELYKLLEKKTRGLSSAAAAVAAAAAAAAAASGHPTVVAASSTKCVFTFDMVGSVIQSLVEMMFQHKFTKLPFSKLSKEQTEEILKDTVRSLFFSFLFVSFRLKFHPIQVIVFIILKRTTMAKRSPKRLASTTASTMVSHYN